jgi:gliding motility-associated-like protein
VTEAGTYWVEVEVCKQGRTARDSINIAYTPIPQINLGKDRTICKGKPQLLDATFPGSQYRWSTGSTESTVTVNQSGTYWVEVVNACGKGSDTISLTFGEVLNIDLGKDTTLCVGQTLYLQTFHPKAKVYTWQNQESSPIIEVKEAGTYWVEVQSETCVVRDTIQVYFKECESELLIPNIITPNGDAANEQFVIKGLLENQWQLEVYSRQGKVVYASNPYNNEWNGSGLPAGIYFYLLRNTRSNRFYKGRVQILR